jgi:FkbM family methyltransferase
LELYGEWANDELELLEKIIQPSIFVLDIGAFIGIHSLAFAKFVVQAGQVHSFEPRKEIFDILSENVAINDYKNITVHNKGLAASEQIIELKYLDINDAANLGGLSLQTDGAFNNEQGYQINISAIDNLSIGKIDYIKLDVEGMERSVLDGAIKTISSSRTIVFCECNSLISGYEVLSFCQSLDYCVFGFLSAAYNSGNFNEVSENIFGEAKELALLMVPPEKSANIIDSTAGACLISIKNLEDLVLPLLHKPQYAVEVLVNTAGADRMGVEFPSPAMDHLRWEVLDSEKRISILSEEIENIYSSTSWKITKPLRGVRRLMSR